MVTMLSGKNRVFLLFYQKLFAKHAITREISIFVKINITQMKITGKCAINILLR